MRSWLWALVLAIGFAAGCSRNGALSTGDASTVDAAAEATLDAPPADALLADAPPADAASEAAVDGGSAEVTDGPAQDVTADVGAPEGPCHATKNATGDEVRYAISVRAGHVFDLTNCISGLTVEWYGVKHDPLTDADLRVIEVSPGSRTLLAVGPGHVTVRITISFVTDVHHVVDVTVEPSDVTSTEVRASTLTPALYGPVDVAIVNHYADGSTADLTPWSTWRDVPDRVGIMPSSSGMGVIGLRPGPVDVPFVFAGADRTLHLEVGNAPATDTIVQAKETVVSRVGDPHANVLGLSFTWHENRSGGTSAVTWSSSAPAVVTRNDDSTPKCLSRGEANAVFALSDRELTTHLLCVTDDDITSIQIEAPSPITVRVGAAPMPFSALGKFPAGYEEGVAATWTSSNTAVAAFSVGAQASTLTFLSPGTTDVTAKVGTHTAAVQVVVTP